MTVGKRNLNSLPQSTIIPPSEKPAPVVLSYQEINMDYLENEHGPPPPMVRNQCLIT
jgi:hypothetical protein